jgi:beta-lactamase superfamily II metal-dependent hydrolase
MSCGVLAVTMGFLVSGFVRPVKAEIIFADVGQGDCCLIVAGNTTCLIDSGTYEKGEKNVSDLLDYYGISRVDIALMTHWDQDHAGGIAALNKSGRIGCIYTGFIDTDSDTEAFDKSLLSRNCDPTVFRLNLKQTKAGDVFELAENVRIKVIYPEKCMTGGNPGSLVTVLECCGFSMLFTGDIDSETEQKLVSEGLVDDVVLLKVSHHGSRYSSCSAFLNTSRPEIAVIQVGKNNLYGHPSPKTVERLDAVGSEIYRTDTDGAVILEFY